MQKFNTLNDAIALAKFGHFKQTDKAGFAYIDHPKRVLVGAQAMGLPPYAQQAAVMHDLTEDTAFTHQMLLDLGFSEAVVEILRLLDRHESRRLFWELNPNGTDLYGEKVSAFYYENINADPMARQIKRLDMDDNTRPWRLSYMTKDTQVRLAKKYAKGYAALGFPVSDGILEIKARYDNEF